MCPIGSTGYGITSFNIVKELKFSFNTDISLFPLGNIHLNSEHDKSWLLQCLEKSKTFEYLAPCLKIWHQNDLSIRPGKGRYAAFPFFELDTIDAIEKHHLNFCDIIFVASQWAKNILQNNGINRPILVAPLGVDLSIFNQPSKIKTANQNYVFFHIGKWEKRKSQDFLLKVFNSAFSEKDEVELWLVPHNPFLTKEEEQYWLNLVNESKLKSKIKIFPRFPTQYDLAELIFVADCGVFLSRAEGWNNEIIECMAMSKPIIATNYSAHSEYCDNKNSYLIDIDDLEPAFDGKWFNGNGKWAKLDEKQFDQAVDAMRYVYNNNIHMNPNGVLTASQYLWKNTANIIYQELLNRDNNANTKKKTKRR